jgi:hypothetical protein
VTIQNDASTEATAPLALRRRASASAAAPSSQATTCAGQMARL